ncbi:hypothetical protein BP6252_04502 [Coleophoma cylindrospora]|uniref:S-adenosyl-L-methionine-dependent methyltransferase n=1 Tax=Coleophoma cylindrospora TaxID=1849047 RepID=A0A3D8S193_9HELO|nr:hypothetical protein BP6252_04502 [Coleophoma cylindrospora]
MFDKTRDVAQYIIDPIMFLALVGCYGIKTFFSLLIHFQFGTLFSVSKFKYVWFARFWAVYGPQLAQGPGRDRVKLLIPEVTGVVLDIGPGTGEWLELLDSSKLTKVYGVEPNADHYARLREHIKEAGLADIYEIIPAGVEDLSKYGIELESVDTILTLQCLCSVPNQRQMIRDLYQYLKPNGGKWVLYEHVVTKQKGIIAMYQATIDLVWPHFLGGCSITRNTEKNLREAGEWSKIDLKQPAEEPIYHMVPHVGGVLVK